MNELQQVGTIHKRKLTVCKAGLPLHFNSLVALIFTPVTKLLLMGELYQLQASSPVTSRVHQIFILNLSRCYGLQPLLTALQRRWCQTACARPVDSFGWASRFLP